MTRINCVPVRELTDKHLIAEYRELPRVFGLVLAYQRRGGFPASIAVHGQPKEYVLGKGHVLFFYTRLGYCDARFTQLVEEMRRRGFKPQYEKAALHHQLSLRPEWYGHWTPTRKAMKINRERIKERLS